MSVVAPTLSRLNIDGLEWQADRIEGVPPRLVDSLLEHGHVDLVARAAAERGDWFCAQGAVRALQAVGEVDRAWAVMKPWGFVEPYLPVGE
ncbi:hypothetical protein DWB77_07262 [Streptomyces hundungensis]|uniref:Uncharacterized protein n=1 Tax=Streptomyces hundungensis TaxID=1077946 RepID=A0A387HMA1_9ACTN|nr:hypothetical protein DWB77_07262 [Streptomyces hundungensis]